MVRWSLIVEMFLHNNRERFCDFPDGVQRDLSQIYAPDVKTGI